MVRFICAQPANLYYAWQVEVMLNNFIEMGINLNYVDIVCHKIDNNIPLEWLKLSEGYAARFFFYNDARKEKNYISSIRPNILKQHFARNPELETQTILYHDCDIVLSKPVDWSQFEVGDVWYGSDTNSYIGYDYIVSKGQDVFDEMVQIVGIDPQIVIDNALNAIGAQYILKGIDYHFWEEVERDSEALFSNITALNTLKKQEDPNYHELQIWCADMWAVLWNIWKRGYKTECHDELHFSWATSSDIDYEKYNIMHNAGVTAQQKDLFYKAKYMASLPYGLDLEIRQNSASAKYYEWVQKAEKVTVL